MAKKPAQDKTRGVILLAFGKRSYYYAAYNMAASIVFHSPDIKITVLTDFKERFEYDLKKRLYPFDEIIEIPNDLLYEGKLKKFAPAKVKLNLFNFLNYDYNIYLDVDGVCLKDINPLFDLLIKQGKSYCAHTVGYHTIDKGREIESMQWAYADDIWTHYELDSKTILPAINSSLQFIAKDKDAQKVYEKALELFENPIPLEKLRMKWGGGQPDELYMNIALAILGIDPKIEGGGSVDNSEQGHIHFCRRYNTFKGYEPIIKAFYIQSYYGGKNFTPSSIIEWLDKQLYKIHVSLGIDHNFKISQIVKDKHANNTK